MKWGFPWWRGHEVSVAVPQSAGLISPAWKDEASLGCESTS